MKYSRLICCATALLLCLALSPTYAQKIKRKGRFLHTEIEGYEDATAFKATLYTYPNSSFPVFKLVKLTKRTIREIKVFETVIDTINQNPNQKHHIHSFKDLIVVPNEFIKDNPTTREEIIVEGPFANTTFTIDGVSMTTDAQGHVADTSQRLLRRFDDLTQNSINIDISHPKYGSYQLEVTRLILKPEEDMLPEYKKEDPKATLDILEGMGIDSSIPSNPGANPLDVITKLPQNIKPGDLFPITVAVTNNGNKITGNLIICTFSRENWLDGKLFYFGNIQPGQSKSFVRLVKAPDAFKTKQTHVTFASWDTVKAQPDNAKHCVINHP